MRPHALHSVRGPAKKHDCVSDRIPDLNWGARTQGRGGAVETWYRSEGALKGRVMERSAYHRDLCAIPGSGWFGRIGTSVVAEVGCLVPASSESVYFHRKYECREKMTKLFHVRLAWSMNERPLSLDTRGPVYWGKGDLRCGSDLLAAVDRRLCQSRCHSRHC